MNAVAVLCVRHTLPALSHGSPLIVVYIHCIGPYPRKMDEFDDLTALSDTMVYRQVLMAFSPVIPASLRRRISRLYPSMHRSVKSEASASASAKAKTAGDAGGDAMAAMRQTSEPGELEYVASLPDISPGHASQRPSTASSASNGVEPCFTPGPEKSQELSDISSLRSSRSSSVFSPVAPKYEAESGLRWNRIAPGSYDRLSSISVRF